MNKPQFHAGSKVTWDNGRMKGTVIGNDWAECQDGGYWRCTVSNDDAGFPSYTSGDEAMFTDNAQATQPFPQYLKGG